MARLRRALVAVLLLALPACQQRMASQPSFRPDEPNPFFADGRGDRPLVPGTVARGHLRTDLALFTGRRPEAERAREGAAGGEAGRTSPETAARTAEVGRAAALLGAAGQGALGGAAVLAVGEERYEDYVDTVPFPVSADVIRHGQDRFMIFCVVCHDPLGTGRGKIVERGYTPPPSYHIERLRRAPVGYLFAVITEGYGSMPEYRQQIPPRDRWAIVAYLRALQLSQHFPEGELSPAMRAEYERQAGGKKP